MKMTHKLWVLEESVFPHVGNFLGRIPKAWAEAETANAEVGITVVNSDTKCGPNFILHQLLFLLKRVFFAGTVQLWPFDGTDGYDWHHCLCYTCRTRIEDGSYLSFRARSHTCLGHPGRPLVNVSD